MRAIIASNAGTIVDFSLLAILVELCGLSFLPASAMSFLLGTTLVYVLNTRWVFPVRRYDRRSTEFSLFVAISIIGISINSGSMWLCVEVAGIHYLLSKIIAGALVFFFHFFMRKKLLFSLGKKSILSDTMSSNSEN